MVFSSIPFLIYVLPVFLLFYHIVPFRYKNTILLLASILLYSWGGPKFCIVILTTTALDFYLVQRIYNSRGTSTAHVWLILSLVLNLGLLVYFKYMNFFLESFHFLFGINTPSLDIILPIGISFYTFESLTYVFDVYRGEQKPLQNVWTYQTYIMFFPKLIAGPIIRYKDMAEALVHRYKQDHAGLKISGFWLFCIGLSKKVILANTIGQQADAVFQLHTQDINTVAAWVGALAYTFQIYFDFSGYSDMAIGLGRMMGFRLADNFNNPYTAESITDFWKRWHISLGQWMRHYLYIPLGGNKNGIFNTYKNLILVFLISGLWHGASFNFILWGAYHGLFLCLERAFLNAILKRLPRLLRVLYTFLVVCLGWIVFKSEQLTQAQYFISKCFSMDFTDGKFALQNTFTTVFILCILFSFWILLKPLKRVQEYVFSEFKNPQHYWYFTMGAIVLFYISLSFIAATEFNPFIYFRF